mgnify:CR=1 FL=1
MIVIASDDQEGVIGKISSLGDSLEEPNIIWTKNESIVFK